MLVTCSTQENADHLHKHLLLHRTVSSNGGKDRLTYLLYIDLTNLRSNVSEAEDKVVEMMTKDNIKGSNLETETNQPLYNEKRKL